jgi:hypothetical protein
MEDGAATAKELEDLQEGDQEAIIVQAVIHLVAARLRWVDGRPL